jgi:Mg/Co/Ni transporter MgtE
MQRNLFEIRRQVAAEALKVEELLEKLRRGRSLDPDELTRELEYLREKLFWISEEAELVKRMKWWQIGFRRFVPLFLTALIELGVAGVLSFYDKVIAAYSALYVFSPMVSAVAGNHGLQVGAQVIRAIATNTWQGLGHELRREWLAVLMCGLSVGVSMGLIAWLITGQFLIFPVLVASFLAGMCTSATMATLMPFLFQRLGLDPAFLLGPFETSLQDLISYTTFVTCLLIFSKVL